MLIKLNALLCRAILIFTCLFSSTHSLAGTLGESNYLEYIEYLRSHLEFYVPISGGYGYLKDAEYETAFSGLLRVGLGSRWRVSEKLRLGTETGFQTGMQMLMNEASTETLWSNALPLTLIIKSPIDLLLTVKYHVYKSIFVETKGGVAYLNTMVSGADVVTSQSWMPDIQAGMGIDFSSNVSLLINYQRFFGKTPQLSELDPLASILKLHHVPTWQAIMFTAEIKI